MGGIMKRKGYFLVFALSFVLVLTGVAVGAAKKPASVAELALYNGADRQKILEEGAKKEGALTFYTSGIMQNSVRPILAAFQKKYPYIKIETWRAGTEALTPKIVEEYKAGKHLVDVVEGSNMANRTLQKFGIVQPFYSPNLAYIEEDAISRAPNGGAFAAVFREGYIGLGYNTKLIPKEQIPKTYGDLLDPKWKGKMPIAGSSTGADWMGTILTAYGEDFVKRLAQQNFDVHMVSASAIIDMVVAGEYALSPTIYESHVVEGKKKGAPVDWIPLEPVHVNVGQMALSKDAHNPHAALLFIDFELSKESAEIHKSVGFTSPRKDVPSGRNYKKFYGVRSVEEGSEWEDLFKRLFVKQ